MDLAGPPGHKTLGILHLCWDYSPAPHLSFTWFWRSTLRSARSRSRHCTSQQALYEPSQLPASSQFFIRLFSLGFGVPGIRHVCLSPVSCLAAARFANACSHSVGYPLLLLAPLPHTYRFGRSLLVSFCFCSWSFWGSNPDSGSPERIF